MKQALLTLSLLLVFASPLTRADDFDTLLVLSRAVPRDFSDLRTIEAAATKVATRVVPCTVGIQVGNNHGSGVIITESGYVLTAAHVTDRPGLDAKIRFPDGTTADGKTLGIHTKDDAALIKISDAGPWPFAPVVTLDDYPYPKPGDWCIATGHPGGFDRDRSPPVRFGRIIDVTRTVIRTDCTINSGDSGGPLFDMQGRVIGIHSRIAEQATVNLHGPVLALAECWKQMKDGEICPPFPESRFLDKLDVDRDGKITRTELPEGAYQRLYDRLAEKFQLKQDRGYTILELKTLLGWRHVPPSFDIEPYDSESISEHALPDRRFIRGGEIQKAFESIAAKVQTSVVEVRCNDKRVALGTVVDGGVLTKASELHDSITCKTHDGQVLVAEIERVDSSQDLALLKLNKQLDKIPLPDEAAVSLGSWLITPGVNGRPISIGVGSVNTRVIEKVPAVLGVQIANDETNATIVRVFPKSGAANAGLRPNDVIVKIMSTEVSSLQEVKDALAKHRAGDRIKATVLRDGSRVEFDIVLALPEDIFLADDRFGSGRLNGELSLRRNDFPAAIQHDSVLRPEDCGGPVIDVTGRVVGINIARADRVATYALPIQVIREVLKKFADEAAAELGKTQS